MPCDRVEMGEGERRGDGERTGQKGMGSALGGGRGLTQGREGTGPDWEEKGGKAREDMWV